MQKASNPPRLRTARAVSSSKAFLLAILLPEAWQRFFAFFHTRKVFNFCYSTAEDLFLLVLFAHASSSRTRGVKC